MTKSVQVKKSSDGQKFRSRRPVSVIQQMANDRRALSGLSGQPRQNGLGKTVAGLKLKAHNVRICRH